MSSSIKVVKKDISGWFSNDIDEEEIAMEIEGQEAEGWQLISSYGIRTSQGTTNSGTDTLIFIYRKQ